MGISPDARTRRTIGVFSLYLHPEDYSRLSGIMELIKADARRALSAKLAQLNAKPAFSIARGAISREP